jgi:hypothetical protein
LLYRYAPHRKYSVAEIWCDSSDVWISRYCDVRLSEWYGTQRYMIKGTE